MPKIDGCTACFELKRDKTTKVIPIVAMTGKGGPLEEKLILTMGAKGYLSKSFTQQDVLDVVTQRLTIS